MKASKSYEKSLQRALQDPNESAAYLDAAIEQGDLSAFLLAVKDVSRAQGGLSKVSQQAGLNRENLYRMLSRNGNPQLKSLQKLLSILGLTLTIKPLS